MTKCNEKRLEGVGAESYQSGHRPSLFMTFDMRSLPKRRHMSNTCPEAVTVFKEQSSLGGGWKTWSSVHTCRVVFGDEEDIADDEGTEDNSWDAL